MTEQHHLPAEPEKIVSIDSEYLSGQRLPLPGGHLAGRGHRPDGRHARRGPQLARGRRAARGGGDARRCSTATPTRSSRSTSRFRPDSEDEIARKVLIKHLQSGNSYGIALKERHCKFPQPELGPWVAGLDARSGPTRSRRCSRAGSRPSTDVTTTRLCLDRSARAADHGDLRVRRETRAPLRRAVAVRELRSQVRHKAHPGRGVRLATPQPRTRSDSPDGGLPGSRGPGARRSSWWGARSGRF